MQILGLLGMYVDAVVVEVDKNFSFFSDWLRPVPSEEFKGVICNMYHI